MWVRIAAAYPIWSEVQPLALYRMHDDNNTSRNVRTGKDVAYNARAIEIMSDYLPQSRARAIAARARSTYAKSALKIAERAFYGGNYRTGLAQFLGAMKLSWTPTVVARAVLTLLRPHVAKVRNIVRAVVHNKKGHD
jgi:hypothetical protein